MEALLNNQGSNITSDNDIDDITTTTTKTEEVVGTMMMKVEQQPPQLDVAIAHSTPWKCSVSDTIKRPRKRCL
jgi:hypothetical protein